MIKRMIFVLSFIFGFIHQSSAFILQDEASGKYLKAYTDWTVTLIDHKEGATDFVAAINTDTLSAGICNYAFAVRADLLAATKGKVGVTAMLCLTCDTAKKLSLTLFDSSSALWTSPLTPTDQNKAELNGVRLIMHGGDRVYNFAWLMRAIGENKTA